MEESLRYHHSLNILFLFHEIGSRISSRVNGTRRWEAIACKVVQLIVKGCAINCHPHCATFAHLHCAAITSEHSHCLLLHTCSFALLAITRAQQLSGITHMLLPPCEQIQAHALTFNKSRRWLIHGLLSIWDCVLCIFACSVLIQIVSARNWSAFLKKKEKLQKLINLGGLGGAATASLSLIWQNSKVRLVAVEIDPCYNITTKWYLWVTMLEKIQVKMESTRNLSSL